MRVAISMSLAFLLVPQAAAGEISIERGLYISIIGGCHDCHTKGYFDSRGRIDPDAALKGSDIGFRGEWGTSYPSNLRYAMSKRPEDEFVFAVRYYIGSPPMPWHNLHRLDESDARSLYRYIVSLGEPGKPTQSLLKPGEKARTPYIDLTINAPPPCTRDLDCGVGDVCSTGEPRRCVPR
jgi:hypothetical protein